MVDGFSDAQLRAALAPFADSPVLHLEHAEGVFGGWGSADEHKLFESQIRVYFAGGSWCCSSYDHKLGTVPYADPVQTAFLPATCADHAAEAAWEQDPHCSEQRRKRRSVQQPFTYNLTVNREGFYALTQDHS